MEVGSQDSFASCSFLVEPGQKDWLNQVTKRSNLILLNCPIMKFSLFKICHTIKMSDM